MRKKRIYWITRKVSLSHGEKAKLLAKRNYEIQYFTNLEDLLSAFNQRRVGIIVVGDDAAPPEIEDLIETLCSKPELTGVRLILSLSREAPNVVRVAAANGFRDVISIDLEPQKWLARFLFSTAGSIASFPRPLPQLTLNNISAPVPS